MLEGLFRDIRYGLRIMLKSPGFTILAVCALALGIGSVTTMFSVINGALWKGLPFDQPHEIVWLERHNEDRDEWDRDIPYSDFEYISENQESFDEVIGFFGGTVNISDGERPVRYTGSRVSAGFSDLAGVQPIIGQPFTAEHDQVGVPPVVLLGYGAWQNQFGGRPDIEGLKVRINGSLGTVIGVMPEGFGFPNPTGDDVWVPLRSAQDWNDPDLATRYSLNVVGRLKDNVSREQAEAELVTLLGQLAEAHPERNADYRSGAVRPFVERNTRGVAQMLIFMTITALCVLLIACANVANLLLARSTQRMKEFAIRSSLGASRGRLLGQLLTESIVIAAFGGLLGTALAYWASGYLMGYSDSVQMPFWFDFSVDWKILGIVSVVTLLTGMVSGLIPGLRASKASINDILKDDTRTGSSLGMKIFSRALVIVQVSVSCLALVMAFFMMKSLSNIVDTDLNFDADTVITARMGLFEGDYPTPEDRYRFFTKLKRNLEARPEIAEAALYGRYRWSLIGVDWTRLKSESLEEVAFDDLPLSTWEYVSWDYFEAMGADLIDGRALNEIDSAPDAAPVVVVNEALARTLDENGNVIGKRIQRARWPQEIARAAERGTELEEPEWYTIVGVAPNMAAMGVGNTTDAQERHFFAPLPQDDTRTFMTIAVRGSSPSLNLIPILREEVQRMDSNLPLYSVGTPASLIEEDLAQNHLITSIFRTLSGLAAILASIGIYGVMSFAVNQRKAEFGIRSALGAAPMRILRMVVQTGALQLLGGIVLGMILAFLATRFMENFFFGVSNNDIGIYLQVALLFSIIAMLAIFFPARRAARVHPARALRHD